MTANRYFDWFRQSEAGLQHARNSLEDCDYEWSCFAAPQAAEKALKAPTDYYTAEEARNAISQAEAILEFCRHQID